MDIPFDMAVKQVQNSNPGFGNQNISIIYEENKEWSLKIDNQTTVFKPGMTDGNNLKKGYMTPSEFVEFFRKHILNQPTGPGIGTTLQKVVASFGWDDRKTKIVIPCA